MINYNTVLHILTMDIEQIPTYLYVDDIHNPEGTWYSIYMVFYTGNKVRKTGTEV